MQIHSTTKCICTVVGKIGRSLRNGSGACQLPCLVLVKSLSIISRNSLSSTDVPTLLSLGLFANKLSPSPSP